MCAQAPPTSSTAFYHAHIRPALRAGYRSVKARSAIAPGPSAFASPQVAPPPSHLTAPWAPSKLRGEFNPPAGRPMEENERSPFLSDPTGREHSLSGDVTVIGRAVESDIVITSRRVSREHACLRREGWRVILEDLGSTNGTGIHPRRAGWSYACWPSCSRRRKRGWPLRCA